MQKESAVIDTCVIIKDPDVIVRANAIGHPIITDVILSELDFNKKNKQVSRKVHTFFSNMSVDSERLEETPDGKKIQNGDILTKYTYKNQTIFVLNREKYKSRGNNDSKIREIAKDYGFHFVTADRANKIAADSEGIAASFWKPSVTPSSQKSQKKGTTSKITSEKKLQKYKIFKIPRKPNDSHLNVNFIPQAGDKAYRENRKSSITLVQKIASGGEGVVYQTDQPNYVAKIYHKSHLTQERHKKIKLMLTKPIVHPAICWPTEILVNANGEFCGYLMPEAKGLILQTSLFVPALLKRKLATWTRHELVNVAIKFAELVNYLNARNIIIGDINPMNVLISEDSNQMYLVDCDSFQIEDFPCAVGTVNFTAADIQGKDYKSFLRTQKHEDFALATMLFMILMPGKTPYSQEGGVSPAENIKSGNFPYPFKEIRSQNVSKGSWRYIWSHFPFAVKEAFHTVFREKKTITSKAWVEQLKKYQYGLAKGYHSADIFPSSMKVRAEHAITVQCETYDCSEMFEVDEEFAAELRAQSKNIYCDNCRRRLEVENLARQSSAPSAASGKPKNQRKSKTFASRRQKKSASSWSSQRNHNTNNQKQNSNSLWIWLALLGGGIWLIDKLGWLLLPIIITILAIIFFRKVK